MFMSGITIEGLQTFETHSDDPRLTLIPHKRNDSLKRRDMTLHVKENKSVDYPVSATCAREDFVSSH